MLDPAIMSILEEHSYKHVADTFTNCLLTYFTNACNKRKSDDYMQIQFVPTSTDEYSASDPLVSAAGLYYINNLMEEWKKLQNSDEPL